jgi:hypothetical protein
MAPVRSPTTRDSLIAKPSAGRHERSRLATPSQHFGQIPGFASVTRD